MPRLNIEIKARCHDLGKIRKILKEQQADFKGMDYQRDIYFNVPQGRMKLRQGNIENSLIYYDRPDQAGPKPSQVILYPCSADSKLESLLTTALGTKIIVEKQREIYFIDNVKFHLDRVQQLGTFIEIEAIDHDGTIGKEILLNQCKHFMNLFGIPLEDRITSSYSDLIRHLTVQSE